jgi:predicted HicB family RNase H-like nuclease
MSKQVEPRVSVLHRIPPLLKGRLYAHARKLGVSANALVATLLKQGMDSEDKKEVQPGDRNR